MIPALRLGIALPALAAVAWTGSYAMDLGNADQEAYAIAQELVAANEAAPGKAPSVAWPRLHDRALVALAAAPADPVLHELLGAIDLQREGSQEYLAEADVHFARALALRPSSPYTWSSIASVKYRKGETGKDFERALVRAAALGPHEPEVQRNVAYLGLAVWDEVAPATRAAIEAMVASGMGRNPAEMLQIATRRGRLPIACRHLAGSPRLTVSKWSQLCQSTEATS